MPLGYFHIERDGKMETVPYDRIDLVNFELQFDKTTTQLSGMVDQYRLGWIAAKRAGLTVPDTFDAFIAAAPDVDMEDADEEADPKEASGDPAVSSMTSRP